MISQHKQRIVIDALRRGTVPEQGLELFAVGLEKFESAIDEELSLIEKQGSVFKAVRGDYGSGKTFFARWLQERARQKGFAVSEVQISESDTPLHKLETIYRRLVERLSISSIHSGAFKNIIDSWFYTLEEDILASQDSDKLDEQKLMQLTNNLMEQRLLKISRNAPAFASVLRGYRKAIFSNKHSEANGLIAWLSGQPYVASSIKKFAAIKGEIDHFAALNFLQGLLLILKDSGHAGLVLVLDEVETLQRVRTDSRDKALNALRQLVDEIDAGRFPGLYLLITGSPMFFDGNQGVQRLTPLAQRLYTDFSTHMKFDNPRAVQIRLNGFDLELLCKLGQTIRNIYAQYSSKPQRINELANDQYIEKFATAITGHLGGIIGIAPRLFLKKLVGDVLDRIDQFPDFNPQKDYELTLVDAEMNEIEKNAQAAKDIDDIELDL